MPDCNHQFQPECFLASESLARRGRVLSATQAAPGSTCLDLFDLFGGVWPAHFATSPIFRKPKGSPNSRGPRTARCFVCASVGFRVRTMTLQSCWIQRRPVPRAEAKQCALPRGAVVRWTKTEAGSHFASFCFAFLGFCFTLPPKSLEEAPSF